MIVRCVAESGGRGAAPGYGTVSVGTIPFGLTRGREYAVYGLALFETGPALLVQDDKRYPGWYATSVFEILDSAVPAGWRAGRGEGYELVLAYPELAESESAMSGLIRLDRAARRHFARQVQARTSSLAVDATPSFAAVADLAGWFHQEFAYVAKTPLELIDMYLEDEAEAVVAELDALFAAGMDEVVAHRIWLVEGRAMFDPAGRGSTCLDWLRTVRDHLAEPR
ncbi:contact-dependent growth inhibition system immunity protein [Amycolatopsis sp. NPDC051716]|uniref:contact-dependent growth inhibition system immunity protein n=1 Tax=Amycolatopsis sp. NPDC051716 TaxID=3155804 RepID=UPI0034305E3E